MIMNNYRKKSYRGKRSYGGRPHRRTADSYHQPLQVDQNKIPSARHTLTKPDVEAVVEALLSGNISGGRELERFESLLAKLTHSEYAIAMCSGTAAIHSALACLKLEPEDEIIVSTLGFGAVPNMIKLVGATLVLVDCDPNSLTLSPEAAKRAVTENTKAIFTSNFGGHPSDLQALREICDEHNLLLIEDAGHGLGGKYRGHYVGNQADLTCFSFNPTKAITTCEGGAVTTNNRAIAEWLRQFRRHGIQTESRFFQSEETFPAYYQELQFLGMNYQMSEVQAALGRSQLTRLDRHIERRRSIAQVYFQKLGTIEELILPYVADWADNAFHFYPIQFIDSLADKRDAIFQDLREAGIEVQVHFVPIHRMPLYSRDSGGRSQFPNAEVYFSRCLSLPLFPDLSYKDLERISDILLKTIGKYLAPKQAPAAENDAPAEEKKKETASETSPKVTSTSKPASEEEEDSKKKAEPKRDEEKTAEPESEQGDDASTSIPEAPSDTTGAATMPEEKNKKPAAKKATSSKSSRLRKVPKSESDESSDGSGPAAKKSRSTKPRTTKAGTGTGRGRAKKADAETKSGAAAKPKATRRKSTSKKEADSSSAPKPRASRARKSKKEDSEKPAKDDQ